MTTEGATNTVKFQKFNRVVPDESVKVIRTIFCNNFLYNQSRVLPTPLGTFRNILKWQNYNLIMIINNNPIITKIYENS